MTHIGRFRGRHHLHRLLAVALAVGGTVAVLPMSAARADVSPVPPVTEKTVTADALPTPQIGEGVVWDQVVVGTTVYAAGEFSTARPAGAAEGTDEVTRTNLLAYDITTGELLAWAPDVNGTVYAIAASQDGGTIFIGGVFNQVNGVSRYRLAAVDAATGATITSFHANVSSRVNDLEVSGSTVYVGGLFKTVAGQSRSRLAAVSTSGTLLAWAPVADAEVIAVTAPAGSGKVVVGGRFTTLNGDDNYGMGALDAATGATVSWPANETVRNAGSKTAIYSLKNDGSLVFGSGYAYGSGGNLENVFAASAADGSLEFVSSCKGDTYDVQPVDGVLYAVGHTHHCAALGGLPEQIGSRAWQRLIAVTSYASPYGGLNSTGNFISMPGPDWLHFAPEIAAGSYTGLDQGAWTVESTADGRYLAVAGEFPTVNGTSQYGLVRFARGDVAPNEEGPRAGQDLVPTADTTSIPGSVRLAFTTSYDRDSQELSYEVLRGATLGSATVIGTMKRYNAWYDRIGMSYVDATAASGSSQTYRIRVKDSTGNVLVGDPVTVKVPSGTATAATYPSLVNSDSAAHYWRLGESSGTTAVDWTGDDPLTLASGATRGVTGPITGDDDTATTFPGSSTVPAVGTNLTYAPRTVSEEAWIKTTTTKGGKIVGFGSSRTGTSSNYDHHVYMSNDGTLTMGIYLDGVYATATSADSYNDGDWHHVVGTVGAGGVTLYVDGERVANSTALVQAEYFRGYWRVGGDNLSGWPGAPTSKAFAGAIDEVAVYFRELSADTVASHWAARGGTANQKPTASFEASTDGLTVSVDASGSTDVDGTIDSYAWDFGDGETATGATASHGYAAGGSYDVTLTVTDDDGATASSTQSVAVVAPTSTFAEDAFERTVGTGLGTADTGGDWEVTGSGADASVADGSGALTVAAGRTGTALLPSATSDDSDVSMTIWPSAALTGGGVYLSEVMRSTSAGSYRVRLRVKATGEVTAGISKVVGSTETFLTSNVTVPSVTWTDGAKLRIRAQAVGTSPTTISARVWLDGEDEPTTWLHSVTDSTSGLQEAGATGAVVYVSGSATSAPTIRIDDFVATVS